MSKSRQEFGKEMQEEIDKMFLDMVFNTPKMWINFETEHAVISKLSEAPIGYKFICNVNDRIEELSHEEQRILKNHPEYFL